MVFYHKIPDLINEGIIAINSSGQIKIYNEIAKNIFGINSDPDPDHLEGTLNDGDIVIIASNMLGADDGGMEPEDLKIIGVDSAGLEPGCAVAAVGKKGDMVGKGLCRSIPQGYDQDVILDTTIDSVSIRVCVSSSIKLLDIIINGISYSYSYLWAAGHMVILDGLYRHVKFYQGKGYTLRKEDMKLILQEHSFKGKGNYAEILDPVNRHILELHPDSDVIGKLLQTAYGRKGNVNGIESLINGIPVRCSIKVIDHQEERIGALLEIMDITELKTSQIEREKAIFNLKNLKDRLINERLKEEAFKDIIGQSSKMKKIIQTAQKVSETNSTVLLLGESGTGKNIFAQAIHKASPRRNGPFVYINCASIPENLLESELFGHTKGSFTGALTDKIGKFELANTGTIFLDEINELPLTLQAKLLHVLQSRTFNKVGGLNPITVDIRIIAASNKDLLQLVSEGSFRKDLFYRINVFPLTIPALREHREDIVQLVEYFTNRLAKSIGTTKKEVSSNIIKVFFNYNWPGNIRELENVLERAMIMAGDTINLEHLPPYILEVDCQGKQDSTFIELKNVGPLKAILEEAEKKALYKALEITGDNRQKAMEMLAIKKTNFYEKLKKFGFSD